MADPKVVGLTPNPPSPKDWVEMKHEGIDDSMRCHPRAVKHWQDRDWVVVDRDADVPVTAESVAADEAAAKKAPRATTGTES